MVSLAWGIRLLILAGIAPSLFEGIARRLGYLSAAAINDAKSRRLPFRGLRA
jgi:hypothetical protein